MAWKILILGVIVATLQLLAARFGLDGIGPQSGTEHGYEITIPRCDAIARTNPDVLFLGDSTVYPMPADFEDQRFTSEMLDPLLPQWHVEGFHGVALTPEFFAASLEYFASRGCRPKAVIMPINIRAFSATMRNDPRYQFNEIRRFFKYDSLWFRAFYRPIKASGVLNWESISGKDYFRTLQRQSSDAPGFETYRASQGDSFSFQNLRDFGSYGVPIRDDNPSLKALAPIREVCESMDTQLIFYITPVNFENIEKRIGTDAAQTARANVRYLNAWLREHECSFLDLSDAVDAGQTLVPDIASSHLIAAGRRGVAEKLAEFIVRSNENQTTQVSVR